GHLGDRLADGGQGLLRAPVAACQTKGPVIDVFAAPVPLVGPGIDEGACAPRRESRSDLAFENLRLRSLAMPEAVEPDLTHDQGTIACDVLQAREVGGEALLRLQVRIEADRSEERRVGKECRSRWSQ